FGGIVPFDFVVDGKEFAWRAGSNQRTTIEFAHDVEINERPLKAGKYGLVVLVSEQDWTFVFTNDFSWGAFQYEPSQDVLRVKVDVKKAPSQECLSYDFTNPQAESLDVSLHWTDVEATFKVSTDVSKNIIADLLAKEALAFNDYLILAEEYRARGEQEAAWEHLQQATANLEEQEVPQHEQFSYHILLGEMRLARGDQSGQQLLDETIASAQGFNMYYYGLNTLLVKQDKQRAHQLLLQNSKDHPEQWQAFLALGEYYLADGNQRKVVDNFKKAFELAPENWKNYARYLYLQNKVRLEREDNE
ncbi:MAG: DUF2911 domain-containing protein, partial [Saprospiraceae bacterium]|nr:DUF2911 domain-containing protein [Saprospiraceae bacterium]